ncbi:MAG: GH3 auxin-responsive promoter family protein [Bacteroidetes bacterium]|nr:GH3 auxin-responsive promoter family protein [Bacteroidota bacterium]
MPLINSIASWLMVKRIHQIELFMKYPHEVQQEWFLKLIESGRETEFGTKHGFDSIVTPEDFKNKISVQNYDSLKPYIERLQRGEEFLLWPTEVKWFAKSAGTTNDKSKFIPVTEESLYECHYRGGKDMITIYCNNYPDHNLFTGKNLALGGSHQTNVLENYETYNGDVSAIIIQNLPMWADFFRAPSTEIALLGKWEDKLERIVDSTKDENVVSLAGVPSWMIVLLKKILEVTTKKNISEVWPNLELYFHGGVNFLPYRESFRNLIGKNIHYLELYNASEGFFGIQDQRDSEELLLMLDYGIFYEFIAEAEWEKEFPETISLADVITGKNYAMVISTTGGLWRYNTGDTILFTSLLPYRFKITGRTKNHINVFGEEVMIGNAEKALHIACEKTNSSVREFTVAPVFLDEKEKKGRHEWIIEFEKAPPDLNYFSELLDNALKSVNSDYEAKRYNNFILQLPLVNALAQGTFYKWMKAHDKLGGQYKVPRLSNNRKIAEEILALK